jgi:predicted RNase H-like HicB family nuclease
VKVGEAIRRLEADGWVLVRTIGSHRLFPSPDETGYHDPGREAQRATEGGTVDRQPEAGGLAVVGPPGAYAVVVEWADGNYSAYAPDLPGCVATGDTIEETIALMREAMALHIEVTREYGEAIPEPRARVAMVTPEYPAMALAEGRSPTMAPKPAEDKQHRA